MDNLKIMYNYNNWLKLNIGCGDQKKEGFEGIDIIDFGQKHILDVREGLPFEDETVDAIRHEHFLEHLTPDEAVDFMNECWRVLKKSENRGVMHIIVPYVRDDMSFVMTHRSFYTPDTFVDLQHGQRWKDYGIRRWDTLRVQKHKGTVDWYGKPIVEDENN